MQGFRTEDYALAQQLHEVTGFPIVPSKAREIAGRWAAVKLRNAQTRAAENANWNQYYLLGNLAEGLEEGNL